MRILAKTGILREFCVCVHSSAKRHEREFNSVFGKLSERLFRINGLKLLECLNRQDLEMRSSR